MALKLSKASKNAAPGSLYRVCSDNKVDPKAGVKYLQDQSKKVIRTVGTEPFPYKIELFDEDQVTSKDRSINEQVFD